MSESDETKPAGRMPIRRPPKIGPGHEPAAPLEAEDALEGDESVVHMIFVKSVILTDDKHQRIHFPVGLVAVPAHLADHWYLKAHGAKRADLQRAQRPE